jgi:biopolymer transport protein ExbD
MSSVRSRFPRDDELDITPMIDMTFLLLIFFMVTSTMDQNNVLQMPPARHGVGVPTKEATVMTILMTNGSPEVYLSDGRRENGPASLAEVTAYILAGLQSDRRKVILKADQDVPSGFVEEVARAANEVEGIEQFFVGVQDIPPS